MKNEELRGEVSCSPIYSDEDFNLPQHLEIKESELKEMQQNLSSDEEEIKQVKAAFSSVEQELLDCKEDFKATPYKDDKEVLSSTQTAKLTCSLRISSSSRTTSTLFRLRATTQHGTQLTR